MYRVRSPIEALPGFEGLAKGDLALGEALKSKKSLNRVPSPIERMTSNLGTLWKDL